MILNENEFKSNLAKAFKLNGVSSLLSNEKADKLFRLAERMLEENEKYNLTAIKEPNKIILNHFTDCALPLKFFKKGASVIDVGCGAGFTSLPFAILREDLRILAVDSTAKRVNYVDETKNILSLPNVECRVMRAEEGAASAEYREAFDYATARAVANMQILSELCLPFVKSGGQFIALKGKNAAFELKDAKRAIAILGGAGARLEALTLRDEELSEERALIIVDKKTKTPAIYPRPYAKISKKPL